MKANRLVSLGLLLLITFLACSPTALVAGTEDSPAPQARVVQGQFESKADQQSLQRVLSKAFGGEVKITNPEDGDGTANALFGYAVALSGETALVGSYQDDTAAGTNAGSAYVYTRSGSTWSLQAKLTANNAAANDWFGHSVALSSDTALIGARLDDTAGGTNSGSAYVFTRSGNTWSQQAQLFAGDAAANDEFGYSVALSGQTAVVGAWFDDTAAGTDAGSAYVYTRSGTSWSQQARLAASDAAASDVFGVSVAVEGDTALVGAIYHATGAGSLAGAAYVYTRSGTIWSQQTRLIPDDGAAGDQFGISVALSGNTALVGSFGDDVVTNTNAGSAYVFTRSGTIWSEQQKLVAAGNAANDEFGYHVALLGDTALVGAWFDDTLAGTDAGSAFIFTRSGTTWSQQAKLGAEDAGAGDQFGRSVALSGTSALVGAVFDNTGSGADAGTAYVYTQSGITWTQQSQLSAGVNATGDRLGVSVAVSGDTALVGTDLDETDAGSNAGSVYVFIRSGANWVQQARLTANDGFLGDSFGSSVALSGNTALIGAWLDDQDSGGGAGSAYVFTRSGTIWSQQAKLVANDRIQGDQFGISVALSNDTALVGALYDDTSAGINTGSAYVFTRSGTTWSQQARLTANDAGENDQLGISVALSGDTALVGAWQDDTAAGNNAGSAYVFTRSGTSWSQQAKLGADDGATGDAFGYALGLSGETALVSAFYDDNAAGVDAGAAYVFTRSGTTWNEQAKLTATGAAAGDLFGEAVALSGDTALISAISDDTLAGTEVGSAYVFMRSGTSWSQQIKLNASDAASGDSFGDSVALSGNTVLIGADYDDSAITGHANVGSAYIYTNNTAPTITPLGTSRRAGDPASNSLIANVNDSEDAEDILAVTVNGSTSATVNGVMLNSISTTPAGVVSANVLAGCSASTANFTLRVTDSGGLFNEANLTVTVSANLPPTLSYSSANAVFGQTLNVNPASGPSDSGSVASVAIQSAGTYAGGRSVNSAGVVSLTGATPVGNHTLVVRASDNCGANTDANLPLSVAQAATTTNISSDTPDPSVTGSNVQVNYSVLAVLPGAGAPSGTVTVSDGVNSCNGTVAAGQCTVALVTVGNRTLTASYSGDSNFTSSSGTAAHTVNPPANTAPTIAAVSNTRRAGDPGSNSTIANVNDAEDLETNLVVTVNGAASSTVNGVSVASISTNASGVVSANITAGCAASSANFTLRVTDSASAFNEANLQVTVDPNLPPMLSYSAANAVFGQTLNVNPASGPSDSGSVASVIIQSPGTYTGTPSVNSSGVVNLSNSTPIGNHTIVVRVTDNCSLGTNANLTLGIGQAASTTNITADTPDPSLPNANVVVSYSVLATAPGAGTPTGTVTVSDGVNSCNGTVAAGQCTVALATSGARTLTASYAGDSNFTGSSDTEAHTVGTGNTPPTISAVGNTRRAGDVGTTTTIANVNDPEDPENNLVVTVNGAASSTVTGVTVASIMTNASGVVSASITASCTASTANFTLRVTDGALAFNEANLLVTVDPNLPPTLSYSAASVASGQAINIPPTTGPSDSGTISSIIPQSPGTYTGVVTVNSAGVVALSNAAPVGNHTIVIRATDNCALPTDANLALTVSNGGEPTANLSISKTVSLDILSSGIIQYNLAVRNSGPTAVTGATVLDNLPAILLNATWTCFGLNNGICASPSGTGSINQLVNLPVNGSVFFDITATIGTPEPGSITNTATVATPAGIVDPVASNNMSTVMTVLGIFRNGFENPPVAIELVPTENGSSSSLQLSLSALDDLAVDQQAVEVIRFQLQDSLLVVQTRRIEGQLQARLLKVNSGVAPVTEWLSLADVRALYLDWAGAAGELPQARLRMEK